MSIHFVHILMPSNVETMCNIVSTETAQEMQALAVYVPLKFLYHDGIKKPARIPANRLQDY